MADQANIGVLRSAELVTRRMQMPEEGHRISPFSPDFDCAEFMMGWGPRRHGSVVSRTLRAHAASEMKYECQISKEARKAKEEKEFFKKGKKDGDNK